MVTIFINLAGASNSVGNEPYQGNGSEKEQADAMDAIYQWTPDGKGKAILGGEVLHYSRADNLIRGEEMRRKLADGTTLSGLERVALFLTHRCYQSNGTFDDEGNFVHTIDDPITGEPKTTVYRNP